MRLFAALTICLFLALSFGHDAVGQSDGQTRVKLGQSPSSDSTPMGANEDQTITIRLSKIKPAGPAKQMTNRLGMAFGYIKAGTFMMGSPPGEQGRNKDERQHRVTLTRGFYLQTTEVTQRQWKAVMGSNPSHFKGDDLPVETVSWNDVREFIRKLNRMDSGNSYRLPTEAEWEYAARAGSETAFANGDVSGFKCGHDRNLS